MDIPEKIKALCKQRGWSLYKLANEAMLTQSTLTNMFARGTMPSIATLAAICGAFEITLSQFFEDSPRENIFSKEETELIAAYRRLGRRDKRIFKEFLTGLAK